MATHQVDIGVLTIREDEFRAVLDVFGEKVGDGFHAGKVRQYALRYADAGNGERYELGILHQVEQGNGGAQQAATHMLADLDPAMVLVVGIAGGLPRDDLTLGDIVLSTHIHDFTLGAVLLGERETAARGGPVDSTVAATIANLAARERDLGMWTAGLPPKPQVVWNGEDHLYGPEEWRRDVRARLEAHHGVSSIPRGPIFAVGPIASSDQLIKDPDVLLRWRAIARDLLAVEMESAGVYRATREHCAMLAIRAVSDIVGLVRSKEWTTYACAAAAAFARAYLKTRPIAVRGNRPARTPPAGESDSEPVDHTDPVRMAPKRDFAPGYFRKPGTLHLHIDGGTELAVIETWAQRFKERDTPTKLTRVVRSIAGPQRRQLRDTYDTHTPGVERESLEYFTTSLLDPSKYDIATLVEETLVELKNTRGIVIELERVIAVIPDEPPGTHGPRLQGLNGAIRFDTRDTARIEVHFLVDVDRIAGAREPLSLESILEISTRSGIDVGGWFLIERSDVWGYRSNSFASRLPDWEALNTSRLHLHHEIAQQLRRSPSDVTVKVIVEESVGVWKTPATRLGAFKTVPELARWEADTHTASVEPSQRAFWVVTPNFLGDKRDDIQRAMVQNLATDVKYTYFLESFADLQRWRKFRSDLKREEPSIHRSIDRNMTAVLLHSLEHGRPDLEECFLRNPHSSARQGYHLARGRNGEVGSGLPMSPERTTEIVNLLEPLEREAQSRRRLTWLPVPQDSYRFMAYVLITDLTGKELDHEDEQSLRNYDLIVADGVSKHGGEVVKSLFDGYVVVFDDEQEDRCGRLQQVMKCIRHIKARASAAGFHQHRIVVDHADVRRVIRAHGYDCISAAITRGRSVLDKAFGDYVIATTQVKSSWESLCGGDRSVGFAASEMSGYWYMSDVVTPTR
jgi:nucleoside phosphorylase/class 3 adenylate cyclase